MKLFKEDNSALCMEQADPYIFKDRNGEYYIYTTGAHMFSSDNLMEGWKYRGDFLDNSKKTNCWGPCMIELDDTYFLYYSIPDSSLDDHEQAIHVAQAKTPLGPFEYRNAVLPPFSIDPQVVKTPSGLYIFYCNNEYEAKRVGTVIMCDRMQNPYTVEGKPVCVVKPTINEEIFQRDRFKKGEHWHTIEGACYFYAEGVHYLMYSGACYQNPTYFIGYCAAYGEEGADLRTLDFRKYPNSSTYAPLITQNEYVESMGHNSILADCGKHFIVYHGRDKKSAASADQTRKARIDELKVEAGRLSAEVTS